MRDNSSPEVVEKKTVSLYELREQILDSFTKILTTTVSNDAFIEKMHPKILDLIGNQIKFLTERKREEINKNSREEIDQKYLKLEKQVSLIEKFYMMEKGEPQIKVNIEQEEIDKLKKDLVLKLEVLNKIQEEDDAYKKLKELDADYKNVEKKDNIHLLLLIPSLIRNFQDIATPDNRKKIEIEYLEALGEVMIMEEIKKFETDYKKGKENYPDLLNKFPVIIISFNIIKKPDNIDKINELTKSLRNLNKKMKNELRMMKNELRIIQPEEKSTQERSQINKQKSQLQKLFGIKPASLSTIFEEREEGTNLTDNVPPFFAKHLNSDSPPKDLSTKNLETCPLVTTRCKSR